MKHFLPIVIVAIISINQLLAIAPGSGIFLNEKSIALEYEFDSADKERVVEILNKFSGNNSMSDLLPKIALEFLVTPYVGGTLEGEPEELRINLSNTDCVIFIETCLSLAFTAKGISIGNNTDGLLPTFDLFAENLKQLRYRNGKVSGYLSRLHYTSDWIIENERKGVFKEITPMYGSPIAQKFYFMSSKPELYPALKGRQDRIQEMKKIEEGLNKHRYYQIPKGEIHSIRDKIVNGDIICFVTNVKGLDISHVGIAYWKGEALHFIHPVLKK